MPSFEHDGLTLAYDDITPQGGAERTLVLVHGFASNRMEGWKRTGWYAALERRRTRLVAIDQRGHGESAKPHESGSYSYAKFADDLIALMDHLGLGQVEGGVDAGDDGSHGAGLGRLHDVPRSVRLFRAGAQRVVAAK